MTSQSIRVGTDVVSVAEVADSIARFGERYLRRVFTEREVEDCGGIASTRADSLAARFAAKEAAIKVLQPHEHQPDWRTIEIRRAPHGACDLVLSGFAADLAARAAISQLAVSLSHERTIATAVVVGLCNDDARMEPVPETHAARAPDWN
jgi:holo-[acyl-carrier protein] synthase